MELDGGGRALSVELGEGEVAVTVHPWEISLSPAGAQPAGSAQNRVAARIVTVTAIGNRARVGLAGPQPLTAEVTAAAVHELGLAPGSMVAATWKAAATRVVPR